jgi:uracil-DNA glycosylase
MVRAANDFALPQIETIRPRLVICLGLLTFQALQRATKRPVAPNTESAINSRFRLGGSTVWCQAHTGQQGQNMRNRMGPQQTDRDWARMKADFDQCATA